MRVLVTITPALKELHDDLGTLPSRHRAERLRTLAQAALLGVKPADHSRAGHNSTATPSVEDAIEPIGLGSNSEVID